MVVIQSRFARDPAGSLLTKTITLTELLPVVQGLKCLEFYMYFSIRHDVVGN